MFRPSVICLNVPLPILLPEFLSAVLRAGCAVLLRVLRGWRIRHPHTFASACFLPFAYAPFETEHAMHHVCQTFLMVFLAEGADRGVPPHQISPWLAGDGHNFEEDFPNAIVAVVIFLYRLSCCSPLEDFCVRHVWRRALPRVLSAYPGFGVEFDCFLSELEV